MQNALHQILEKISTRLLDAGMKAVELRQQIEELEGLLQEEKEKFQVAH